MDGKSSARNPMFNPAHTTAVNEGDYQVTERDVVVGDHANTMPANRLLGDFVGLHQQLGHLQEETLDDVAHRLIKLLTNGMEGVRFLRGKGHFAKISGISSTIASDDEVLDFVKEMLKAEMKTAIEELKDPEGEVEETEKNGVHEKAEVDTNESVDTEENGEVHESRPGQFDIKVPVDEHHSGNIRFQKIFEKYTVDDKLTIMAPHSSRVKATRLILRRTIDVADETCKARFMQQQENGSWSVLDDKEVAEYVMCCIFDALLSRLSSFPPSEELKSLIPSLGSAELSQFLDFSMPSTIPVEEPTDFDVLFGRGGMTNSHIGNKRFRDIISLHRPDYVRAIKIEKPNVARRIVAAIRGGDPPGRFMKRNPDDLMWYDVGNRHATEKTSQALREKSQLEKNGMVPGTSEADVRRRLLEQALSEARATRLRLRREGGSKIGNCLDPTTFKLLTNPLVESITSPDKPAPPNKSRNTTQPEKAPAPEEGGPADDLNVVFNGDSKKSDSKDSTQKRNNKLAQKLPPMADAEDVKIRDTAVSIGPSSSIGVVDENGNIVVTESDILCGRGGLTNHHKGNKRFRDVVALHRPDYVRASKVQKPAVARMIVKAIRNSDPPGRFLKKDTKMDKWVDIGDKRAAEKASQALREKPPEERSKLRKVVSDDTVSKTDENAAKGRQVDSNDTASKTDENAEVGKPIDSDDTVSKKDETSGMEPKNETTKGNSKRNHKNVMEREAVSDDERSKKKVKTEANESDLEMVST